MPLNAEARRARATLAAERRHRPDADTAALEAEFLAALERSRQDETINALLAIAPDLTPEQKAKLRPVFTVGAWGPAPQAGAVR